MSWAEWGGGWGGGGSPNMEDGRQGGQWEAAAVCAGDT